MKFILDTNVWISFLLKKSERKYLTEVIEQGHTIFSSPHLIHEILDVCSRPKARESIGQQQVDALVSLLKVHAESIDPAQETRFERDPNDEFLLDLAAASTADFLVTGDKALLELGSFQHTKIITLKDFKDFLEK